MIAQLAERDIITINTQTQVPTSTNFQEPRSAF